MWSDGKERRKTIIMEEEQLHEVVAFSFLTDSIFASSCVYF